MKRFCNHWRRILTLLTGILVATSVWADASIQVKDAWLRSLPAVSRVNSAYLVISNDGDRDDRLLSARTNLAKVVEIHRSVLVEGAYHMEQVQSVAIPAGDTLTLKSGDYHLMLKQLARSPGLGERVVLYLSFERAGELRVDAEVRSNGQPQADSHSDHSH